MNRGYSYKSLPDSNILFICTFDPFKKGFCKYTFRECCEEDYDTRLDDGITKIFYNCNYTGTDIPADLQELYEYIQTGKVKGELTEKIEQAVKKGRKDEAWRTEFMKEKTIIQDAKDEGREEGIKQLIESMLLKGKTADEIISFCDISPALVNEVKNSLKHENA
ncbi:MAG: hypothetical protein K5886_12695 [Lachnospiraceae bacterium]|nr:hypothetical protein [Lachnospiraceae bacterium]